jgi:hypothetical protein
VYRKYKTSAEISAGGKEYTKDVGLGNPSIIYIYIAENLPYVGGILEDFLTKEF